MLTNIPKLLRASIKQEVGKFLKTSGFRAQGASYVAQPADTRLVVEPQYSRDNDSAHARVAVNLLVIVPSILRFEDPTLDDARQQAGDPHVRTRLRSVSGDDWWSASDEGDLLQVTSSIIERLATSGLGFLATLSTETAVRDLWLRREFPGLTGLSGFLNLTVLLKKYGPAAAMADAERDLLKAAGESHERMARAHLARLQAWSA